MLPITIKVNKKYTKYKINMITHIRRNANMYLKIFEVSDGY